MTITRRQRIVDVLLAVLAAVLDLLVWSGDDELRTGGTAPSRVIPAATTAVCATLVLRRRFPLGCLAVQWLRFRRAAAARLSTVRRASRRLACGCAPGVVPHGSHRVAGVCGAVGHQQLQRSERWPARRSGPQFRDHRVAVDHAGQLVWGLGRLAYTSARKAEHLHSMQQVAAADAVRLERMRLARELHDIVAHAVSVMILQASGARSLDTGADPRVSKSLEVIESAGIQAMGELHRLLSTLRAADRRPRPPTTSTDRRGCRTWPT